MVDLEIIVAIDEKLVCCGERVLDDCEKENLSYLDLDLTTEEGLWQAAYEVAFNRVKNMGCKATRSLECLINKAKLQSNYEIKEQPLPSTSNGVLIGFSTRWGC